MKAALPACLAVLGLSQQDVAGYRAFEPRLETVMVVQQHQRFSLVRQPVHERGRDHDIAEADQPANVVKRHLELLFTLDIDAHSGVFQMGVGLGRHDVERVLDGMQLIPQD